jgi:hypothetical protein
VCICASSSWSLLAFLRRKENIFHKILRALGHQNYDNRKEGKKNVRVVSVAQRSVESERGAEDSTKEKKEKKAQSFFLFR